MSDQREREVKQFSAPEKVSTNFSEKMNHSRSKGSIAIFWQDLKLIGLAAMAALACLLGIGQAGAWNQADLDKLLETNECEGCDLSGVSLNDRNLQNAKLFGADLSNTKLFSANLDSADLSGVDLRGASLINARLVAANLRDAKNVDSANFARSDLSAATWTDGRTCKPHSFGKCK